ncbi:MAG: hypothetical protein LUH43_08440 [Clostridia bacterium]|nr:hypothetical protein [Clostridia bacterium]
MKKLKIRGELLIVEITKRTVRLARVLNSGNSARLLFGVALPLPEGTADDGKILDRPRLFALISSALSENPELKAESKKVIFLLSTSRTLFTTIDIPTAVSDRKIGAFISSNDDILFPERISDKTTVYETTSPVFRDKNGTECRRVRIWSTSVDILKDYYDLADDLGLNTVGIEHFVNAFASCCGLTFFGEVEKSCDDLRLYVRADEDYIILLLARGGSAELFRIIRRTDAECDASEVNLALEYYKSRYGRDGFSEKTVCAVSGSAFAEKEFASVFSARMPFFCDTDDNPEFALCLGAAQMSVNSGLPRRARKPRASTVKTTSLAGAAALTAAIALTVNSLLTWNDEISALRQKSFDLEASVSAIPSYESEIEQYEKYSSDSEVLRYLFDDSKFGEAIHEIEASLGSSSLDGFDTDDGIITASFSSPSPSDAAELIASLRTLKSAELIDVGDLFISDDGTVSFEVRLTFS